MFIHGGKKATKFDLEEKGSCSLCYEKKTLAEYCEIWNLLDITQLCADCAHFIKRQRKDGPCCAKEEYEGTDVPDSWSLYHNFKVCSTCKYYDNMRKIDKAKLLCEQTKK